MSSSAWCDLNSKGNIKKPHDKCPNFECNCQKIITFTPHHFMHEGGSIKNKMQKIFTGTKNGLEQISKTSGQCSSAVYWYGCFC